MHFEILIEDISGKKTLELLLPKLIDEMHHTYKVISYKGIGRIPKNLGKISDASKRNLLNQLPRLLRGYGNTFSNYSDECPAAVILVCDLDNKNRDDFLQELKDVLDACHLKPETRFCIAIEEGEAWFLGDIAAIKSAYPRAKDVILNSYQNDSICGTWEKLAEAVYPGGLQVLSKQGWQMIGKEKSKWAEEITPHMDVDNNQSPSFNFFKDKIQELTKM